MGIKRVLTGVALATAAASPTAASASVTITAISGDPAYVFGTIHSTGNIGGASGQHSLYVDIGRNHLAGVDNDTLAAVSFDAYCIDIFHYLRGGSFDIAAFTIGNAAKDRQLVALLTNTAGAIDAAANAAGKSRTAAAIQLAVWEIAFETGTDGYLIGSGDFFADNLSMGGVSTLAQGYLDSLGGWSAVPGQHLEMMAAVSPLANQRQVFLAAGAVPEPSAWALMIAGFGLVGGAMRTRRKVRVALA